LTRIAARIRVHTLLRRLPPRRRTALRAVCDVAINGDDVYVND
jgi:hypothetical protein